MTYFVGTFEAMLTAVLNVYLGYDKQESVEEKSTNQLIN